VREKEDSMARKAIVGRMNLFSVFMSMLKSVGGTFEPYKAERPESGDPREPKEPRKYRLIEDGRYVGSGTIRRAIPKRDKSISARQWKKRVKAQRRMIREAQLG
jgi:hypothetical protein